MAESETGETCNEDISVEERNEKSSNREMALKNLLELTYPQKGQPILLQPMEHCLTSELLCIIM